MCVCAQGNMCVFEGKCERVTVSVCMCECVSSCSVAVNLLIAYYMAGLFLSCFCLYLLLYDYHGVLSC